MSKYRKTLAIALAGLSPAFMGSCANTQSTYDDRPPTSKDITVASDPNKKGPRSINASEGESTCQAIVSNQEYITI